MTRSTASRLALPALLLVACNAVLGNERRVLDDDNDGVNTPPQREDASTLTPDEAGGWETVPDAAGAAMDAGDAGVDGGPRRPDPTCLKSTSPKDNVLRVEVDTSPAPTSDGGVTAAHYSIYGNNALTNVRLDFCTPDGARSNVGGGFDYLGAAGGANHRWETKNAVSLPLGIVQAQVIADGSPSLKLVFDIEVK